MQIHIIRQKHMDELSKYIILLSFLVTYLFPDVNKIHEVVTGLYAVIGLLLYLFRRKITAGDCMAFFLALLPLLYSNSSEGVRYYLLMISLITWSKIRYMSLDGIFKIIVVFGAFSSVEQIIHKVARIYGFMGSPTQFSAIMLICQTYLLIKIFNHHEKKMILYPVFTTFLIFLSGTRSILAGALISWAYYLLCIWVQNSHFIHKRVAFFLSLVFASTGIYHASGIVIELLTSKMNRSGMAILNSNRTRMKLAELIFDQMRNQPLMILIGKGSGYVENLIENLTGHISYLPVHQDYLLLLAEFGVMGIFLIYVFLLHRHHAKWLFLFMFTVLSFHNILLNTRAMILMTIVMCDVEYNKYSMVPFYGMRMKLRRYSGKEKGVKG